MPMTIAYIVLSAVVGLAVGYLVANRNTRSLIQRCAELQTRLQAAEKENEARQAACDKALKLQSEHLDQAIRRERQSADILLQEAKASYRDSLEAMKTQFARMAEEAMKARAEELKQTNAESIAHLVKPVREELSRMLQSVTDAREQSVAQQASLDKTIEGLLKHTQEVERNAASLAQALQSNGKMQGDWGEQLLASILENSGLREGQEFEVQKNVKDKDGNNFRMDVVVNCPGKRRIIIDSKVSLTAYLNYAAAQTKEEVETAQKENLRSVRSHIDELARKQYDKMVPGALNQVLMFIPNEGSYILALRTDPQIGQYAYKKGIILINPTNLMLALQMIFNLWQTERQNKNTENITRHATDLYDKFVTFIEKFEKIKSGIMALQNATDEAHKTLNTGKGNIVRQLEGLKQMGITPKKQIAEGYLDPSHDEALHEIE